MAGPGMRTGGGPRHPRGQKARMRRRRPGRDCRLAPALLALCILAARWDARAQAPGVPPAPSRAPGVANVGPPEAALLPGLAALQDRLEDQGWLLRSQA